MEFQFTPKRRDSQLFYSSILEQPLMPRQEALKPSESRRLLTRCSESKQFVKTWMKGSVVQIENALKMMYGFQLAQSGLFQHKWRFQPFSGEEEIFELPMQNGSLLEVIRWGLETFDSQFPQNPLNRHFFWKKIVHKPSQRVSTLINSLFSDTRSSSLSFCFVK